MSEAYDGVCAFVLADKWTGKIEPTEIKRSDKECQSIGTNDEHR